MNREPVPLEPFRDHPGRLVLLEADLGMPVEMASDVHHVVQHRRGRLRKRGHARR
jgi:hypothetical protein